MRSGTENLPGCMGFGIAASAALAELGTAAHVGELRDRLEALIRERMPAARPAVPPGTPRAPHIASVLLPGLPAEPILHALEARGVCASEGAACSTRAHEQSRVLRALGVPTSTGALRFSLSRFTTAEQIDHAAGALAESVAEIARVVNAGR